MEKRWNFILGDLFANVLVATAAAALTSWLIGGSWGMLPGMLIGMLIGMAVALPLGLGLLTPLLGVMEVVSPCMLAGMFGGMFGGMWPLEGADILRWGAGGGLASMALIYSLNAILTGPQKLET